MQWRLTSMQAVLDCSEQFIFAATLGQKTACTGLVCPVRKALICMHGEDENPCGGELRPDDPGCFNPIDDRHGDVHQHDIGSVFCDSLDGIYSISCLSNDLQVGF